MQTSTVTVAAFRKETTREKFDPQEIRIIRTKDSGRGGQHRNKTRSAIVAIHESTGITAKAADRKQGQNLQKAMREIEARVTAEAEKRRESGENDLRRVLARSGERGDKIRTYRERDNVVIDHRTGRKLRLDAVLRGEL